MSESPPTLPAEVLAALEKGDAIICYAKCHSCMFQQCPGGWHTWADDPSDWERVVYLLGPDPRQQKCGCPCVEGPELEVSPDGPELEVSPDGPDDWGSLYESPCPLCGALGECASDSEGRPLIHALPDEDGDER